mmetsp:Transcript_28345/g.41699  ORF Transcript_28345/g.41699 Transcript_28345/m.41699 type:complete len:368 (-) Transcript_28345:276-1379(-)
MTDKQFKIAIAGATGAVGKEIINVLHAHGLKTDLLALYASSRSAGKVMPTPYGDITIQEFDLEGVRKEQFDVIFLAVSGSFSLKFARKLAEPSSSGAAPLVIDNSSALRLAEDVPLVVPEINANSIPEGCKLIANPNCTTAIAVMALWPIHCAFGGITKCIMSTYQAASGAGEPGMQELIDGLKEHHHLVNGGEDSAATPPPANNKVFAHPLPFNVIPHIDSFQSNGYTKEEMKVTWEMRKIFNVPDMAVSCTAVRVPTIRAHSEAITVETADVITPEGARECLVGQPGVVVIDNVEESRYPMPLTATQKEDVEVGRFRQSLVFGERGLDMFVVGDQILRGAALNAVLIAECILLNNVKQSGTVQVR